jgi:exodeoxyribonuclease V gamma subunit
VRAFLQRRLGLYLEESAELLADREPMSLDSLSQWRLGDALLGRALAGEDIEAVYAATRAQGVLPLGVPGRCEFADLREKVETLAGAAVSLRDGESLPPVPIDGTIGDTRISGVIRDVWPAGQLRCQFARIGGKHEIGPWIRHVLLNWASPQSPRPCFVVGPPARGAGVTAVRFAPPADCEAILRVLVEFYWLGQRGPLPFFAGASRAFVDALQRRPGDEDHALRAAAGAFSEGWQTAGDADAYTDQVFGERIPLEPGFRMFPDSDEPWVTFGEVSRRVLQPLLEHRSEVG